MIEYIPPLNLAPNTDEEDRYIKMKDFYKQGKLDAELCAGACVSAHEMAMDYTDDLENIQQYINGWNYQIWLMAEGYDEWKD